MTTGWPVLPGQPRVSEIRTRQGVAISGKTEHQREEGLLQGYRTFGKPACAVAWYDPTADIINIQRWPSLDEATEHKLTTHVVNLRREISRW